MLASCHGAGAALRRGWLPLSLCVLSASVAAAENVVEPEKPPAALAGPPIPYAPAPLLPRHPSKEWTREIERRGHWKLDAALAGAGQVADLLSTEYALASPDTREANPFLGARGVRIPLKLGVAAGTAVACRQLRRRGRHTQARVLAVVSLAIGAAAAVHNLRVGSRPR